VTGRRPFAKDPILNYDYDSEAEWEEEDPEGEDIALSDNEEDNEADEIEYDDFFRPDNEVEDIDGGLADTAFIQAGFSPDVLGLIHL
jgi:chromatin assembly factor 1 subunit A